MVVALGAVLGVTCTACGSTTVDGTPSAAPTASRTGFPSQSGGDLPAFCDAVHTGSQQIKLARGNLSVTLHAFVEMNEYAPRAIKPDTAWVVRVTRHAVAVHKVPDLYALSRHAKAVAQWSADHCN